MADDIDIEEHDVLQNPVIRSIFPDISVIKKEISEYYEEVPGIKQEPETVGETTEKIPEKALVHIVDTSYFDNIHKEKETLNSNKIILGSKPSKNVQQTKKEQVDINCDRKNERDNVTVARIPKVLLQNLGTSIFETNRYCKDCLTLFPCKSDYDNHNRNVHPVITRNKKLQIQVTLEKQNLKQTKYKCKICNSCFTSCSNLSRHYKNIHRKSLKTKSRQTDTSAASRVTKSSKNLSITKKPITRKKVTKKITIDVNLIKNTNKCSVCQSLFSSHYSLYRHYKNVHKNEVIIKRNKNVKKTAPLTKKISRVIVKRNKGMRGNNLVSPKSDADNTCFHCNKLFPDKKTLIEHIYEVLEPKRRSKGRLSNTILRNLESKATEKNKTCQINLRTDKVSGVYKPRQRLQDKLIFENEDHDLKSDNNDIPVVNKRNVLQNINENNLETNLHNENVVNEYQDSDTNSFEMEDVNNEGTESIPERKGNARGDIPAQQKEEHSKKKRDNCLQPLMMKQECKRKHGTQQSNPSKEISDLEYCKPNNVCLDTTKRKIKKIKVHSNSAHEFLEAHDKDADNIVYECIYCTYMLKSARAYYMHVTSKHKVEKVPKINKIIFYEKCKYCPSKSINESAHNTHIFKFHYDLLFKNFPNEANIDNLKNLKKLSLKNTAFKKLESFVLKSIIYKCNKCDIHFLSSYIAKDHEKHMELLINWKCSICKRIFKKHDKHLHLKQHQFSKSLNVCQFNESELSRLLYNCTKCAIHFTEDRYLEHYSKCGLATTDSVYCKRCDILIDKHGYKRHDACHAMGKNATDFTTIVADILEEERSNEIKTENKRKRLYEQVNCLTFCKTCKCYLTDVGLSRKSHIEARCSHIQKAVCNTCGLVLTNRAAATHKEHHKKDSSLNLQSYKFFDLKGIQINPPVPEYPHCTNCDVYFVNKNAVKSHTCSDVEYFSCHTCNIKLSENAYKFHVKFHEYAMSNINQTSETDKIISLADPMLETEQKVESKDISSIQKDVDGDISENNYDNTISNTIDNKQETESVIANPKSKIMYSCKTCKVAIYSYDKVIEHCQNHFSPIPTATAALKICAKCSLKYASNDYEKHQKYHSQNDVNKILSFDPTYFASDDAAWIEHIFASVPLSIQKKVLSESIYRYERRLKMKIIQKGPAHLTVYRCDKCGFFIDPECLFAHSSQKCAKHIRKFPCAVCGLLFMSCSFRVEHEKIHRRYNSVHLKSYNIVLINCEEHKIYNTNIFNVEKQSVLYQCKTCNGVVDKLQRLIHQCNVDDLRKCAVCKLLFSSADFNKHVFLHNNKNKPNKKIILFDNQKKLDKTKQAAISICKTINVDTNTINRDVNHKGMMTSEDIEVLASTTNKIFEYDKVKFPVQNNTTVVPIINKTPKYNKSEDILMITENNINENHEDLNILENNKHLVSFDGNSENNISEIKTAIKIDESLGSGNAHNNGNEDIIGEDKIKVPDSNVTEYVEDGSVKEREIIKIPPCYETEGDSDDYVESVENKKMLESNVSKSENNKKESVETTSENNEKYNVDNHTVKEKSPDISTATNLTEIEMKANDDEVISNQQAVTLYKCICGLHYADELNAKNCCPAKNKVIRQTCSKCSLDFNPKELFTHLIAFHKDRTKKYIYDVIEIDTEK